MNAQPRGEATMSRLSGDRPAAGVAGAVAPGGHQEPVELGPGLHLGGASVPVFAGPRRGADAVHISLTSGPMPAENAAAQLAAVRDLAAGPVVVSGVSAATAAAVTRLADAVLVPSDAVRAGDLTSWLSGLSVLLAGDADWSPTQWRGAVQCVREAGGSTVAISVPVGADLPAATDLAAIRLATGAPVIGDVGGDNGLVAPAVAAGADGIWLSEHADEQTVATAREVVARLAPTVRQVAPGTLPGCREAIDRVDAALATLLEYRAGLTARVQTLKPVSGHAGRDAAREAEIVRGMAARAPALGEEGLRPIVEAIITAGLDAAARNRQPDPPVWRL